MSKPLSRCLISKAALGDPKAYQELIQATKVSVALGQPSVQECSHTPPCPQPTKAQIEALDAKLQANPVIQSLRSMSLLAKQGPS